MSDQTPPAGWYPDPTSPGQQRWWDGTAWTDHRSGVVTPQPSTPTASGWATPPAGAYGGVDPTAAKPGPPLALALIFLGLGLVVGIIGFIGTARNFATIFSQPSVFTPNTFTRHLEEGDYSIYEHAPAGAISAPVVQPRTTHIRARGGAEIALEAAFTQEEITRGTRAFHKSFGFHVDSEDDYDITVGGQGEVIIVPAFEELGKRSVPWVLLTVAGGAAVVVGAILWIVGGVRRGRWRRAQRGY